MNELQLGDLWRSLLVGLPATGVFAMVAGILAALTQQYRAAVLMGSMMALTGAGTVACVVQATHSYSVVFALIFILSCWITYNWVHKINDFFFCQHDFCTGTHKADMFLAYFWMEALVLFMTNLVSVISYTVITSGMTFEQKLLREAAAEQKKREADELDLLALLAELAENENEKEKEKEVTEENE